MSDQIHPLLAAYPLLATACAIATPLGVLALIVLAKLANVELSPEQMRASPRYASLVIFAKYIGPYVRPALKFLGGVLSSTVAKAMIEVFLQGNAAGPISSTPPDQGGRP